MNAALSSLHPTESPVFSGLDLIVDFRPEKKAAPLGGDRYGLAILEETTIKGGNQLRLANLRSYSANPVSK